LADKRVPGLTSIIIPTHNHGAVVSEAIHCALAQTSPCEVIVVDDGSTDGTFKVLADLLSAPDGKLRIMKTAACGPSDSTPEMRSADGMLRVVTIPHSGPSAARNAGLDAAFGEFVMFLDADDLIDRRKVERQLAQFTDEIGWVLCDVRIEDAAKNGRVTTASEQYRYAEKNLGGWIREQLVPANFIPIMSPLVRSSVLDGVRFSERIPEDWYFWLEVAARARVRYLPEVLAVYRHGKTGRSRVPKASSEIVANVEAPLRLNLGCGAFPIPGMVNLDKRQGWRFQDGLDFPNHSVHGITISHALMYLPDHDWPAFFSEMARVLVDGGVVRITEDDTDNPNSARFGGWKGSEPAVTMTWAEKVIRALDRAGLAAYHATPDITRGHESLLQSRHGAPPDVFYVEGVRGRGVLLSPHNDDETLFAAFTIIRHRPRVVVCFQSERDYGDPAAREAESREAVELLGASGFEQWRGEDMVAAMRDLDARTHPERVWAPDKRASHPQHVEVARAAREVFGDRVVTYHTYDQAGKVRDGRSVPYEPEWVHAKLRALCRYQTQATHPRAGAFFTWDLLEYQP